MKNLSLYSFILSVLAILLFCISQFLGNVNGELNKERATATIIVAILGFFCWLFSLIIGIKGLKNKKNKTITRYSGMIVSSISLFGIIIWGFLLSFSL